MVSPLNVYLLVKDQFDLHRTKIENFVFQSLPAFATTPNPGGQTTTASRLYTYSAFFESLRTVAVDGILGHSYHADTNPFVPGENGADDQWRDDPKNKAFYMAQDDATNSNAKMYAIVNICAFMAQAMVESIQFDACE